MSLIHLIRLATGATITKEWIEGIRKSWKNVIQQVIRVSEKHEGLDSLEALENAVRYINLLQQHLLFGKGLYPHSENRTITERLKDKAPFNIQAKTTVHLENAREALEEGIRRIKYWREVTDPKTTQYTLDNGRRVEQILSDERFKGLSEGQSLMKFLNWQTAADAQEYAKKADVEISGKLLRALSSFTSQYPGMHVGEEIEREFSVGRLKVVFEDIPIRYLKNLSVDDLAEIRSPRLTRRYVKPMATAMALLKQKKLDFLWYGLVRVECKNCGGKNPYDTPEKVFGVGAVYIPSKDQITIYVNPDTFITELLIHELGHRYYYKFMSMADRAEFSSYFGQVPGVSDYGKTISSEDFAEVFAWYVLNRHLTSDQLGRFKKFLGRKQQRGASALSLPRLKLLGTTKGLAVYEVDGAWVREHLDPDFTNFGYDLRWPFIPKGELWVDHEQQPDEWPFYVKHMLAERRLLQRGLTLDQAQDLSSRIEQAERQTLQPERNLTEPKLKKLGKVGDLSLWLVDGKVVRDSLYVDFTEGGHDLVYHWIPSREIWIDNDVQPTERRLVILHELFERRLMSKGWTYTKAHQQALAREDAERTRQKQSAVRDRRPLRTMGQGQDGCSSRSS